MKAQTRRIWSSKFSQIFTGVLSRLYTKEKANAKSIYLLDHLKWYKKALCLQPIMLSSLQTEMDSVTLVKKPVDTLF